LLALLGHAVNSRCYSYVVCTVYSAVSYTCCVAVVVLPPVLVPRYSEYPSQFRHSAVDSSAGLYQPVSEPILPYNASYPYGFRDQQPSGGYSSTATACSLPGIVITLHI